MSWVEQLIIFWSNTAFFQGFSKYWDGRGDIFGQPRESCRLLELFGEGNYLYIHLYDDFCSYTLSKASILCMLWWYIKWRSCSSLLTSMLSAFDYRSSWTISSWTGIRRIASKWGLYPLGLTTHSSCITCKYRFSGNRQPLSPFYSTPGMNAERWTLLWL